MTRDSLPNDAQGPGGTRLLALATSGAWASAALLRTGQAGIECDSLAEPAGPDQSARMLAMVGELLPRERLDSLDAIAFDAGPGAFTGLRIGCSVAQGLAFARGLPLIEVGSLEAAAWRSLRASGLPAALVLAVNDARMGEVYAALFSVSAPASDAGAPICELLAGPAVARPEAPPPALARAALEPARPDLAGRPSLAAGDAWHGIGLGEGWRRAIGLAPGAGPQAALRSAQPGDARAVAELALGLWRAGLAVPAEAASPRYVRDKVALDVDEQRLLRERKAGAA